MILRYLTIACAGAALIIGTVGAPRDARADEKGIAAGAVGVALAVYGLMRDRPPQRDPDMLSLGAGMFNVFGNVDQAAEFRIEFRPGFRYRRVGTLFGIDATSDGGFIAYAGARIDVPFGDSFIASPNFSIAGYQEGDGKDLGASVQFRSGIDLFWRFARGGRAGLSFHHLSHAGLFGEINPGAESLLITYSIPLSRVL